MYRLSFSPIFLSSSRFFLPSRNQLPYLSYEHTASSLFHSSASRASPFRASIFHENLQLLSSTTHRRFVTVYALLHAQCSTKSLEGKNRLPTSSQLPSITVASTPSFPTSDALLHPPTMGLRRPPRPKAQHPPRPRTRKTACGSPQASAAVPASSPAINTASANTRSAGPRPGFPRTAARRSRSRWSTSTATGACARPWTCCGLGRIIAGGGYEGGGAWLRGGGEWAKGSTLPYEGEKGALGIAEVGWTERRGIFRFAGLWW